MMLCTNADPKCHLAGQSLSQQSPVVTVTDICCSTHSLHNTPQTYWKNGQHGTLCTRDIHQSSLMPCKLWTQPYCGHTLWCEVWMRARATWYIMVWKWMFIHTMSYALLWKYMFACTTWYAFVCRMYAFMYDTIWFGVKNEFLHVLKCKQF